MLGDSQYVEKGNPILLNMDNPHVKEQNYSNMVKNYHTSQQTRYGLFGRKATENFGAAKHAQWSEFNHIDNSVAGMSAH